MPTFRTSLPPKTRPDNLKLKRVPPRGVLTAICLSDELTVVDTHFWHGRTTPCEREVNEAGDTIDDSTCEPCNAKHGYRPHAYVACWDPKLSQRFLLELTAFAAQPLATYRAAQGTLRGAILYAFREKGTPNGAVTIRTEPANLTTTHLPTAPNVPAALQILWRLPAGSYQPAAAVEQTMDAVDGHCPTVNRLRPNGTKLAEMHTPPDNAGAERPTPRPATCSGPHNPAFSRNTLVPTAHKKHSHHSDDNATVFNENQEIPDSPDPTVLSVGAILNGNGSTKT